MHLSKMTVAFAIMLTAVSCGNDSVEVKGSTVTTTITQNTVVTTPPTTTTTTTTNPPIDFNKVVAQSIEVYGKCGEWHDLAIKVGWKESQWKTLSYVIHRESRCNIGSHNKLDPNGGSRGLMQINGFWCRKSRYNQHGWLQAQGVLTNCDELFNPEVNLRAGLAMWQYSQERNKCGWNPWATKCK